MRAHNMRSTRAANESARQALEAGLGELRGQPEAAPPAEALWQRVSARLNEGSEARPAVPAAPRRSVHPLAWAAAPVLAFGLAMAWFNGPAEVSRQPAPRDHTDLSWAQDQPSRENWIDDPAGDSTDRLWSGLDHATTRGGQL